MSDHVRNKAIVLGGSMAGLLAARVLADSFQEVTIIDRDALTDVLQARRGVPQGSHAHALLARGQQVLEELFPGLSDEMRAGGLPLLDMAEMHWHVGPMRLASIKSGLIAANVARPLLESMVRARVIAMPTVTTLEHTDIVAPVTTEDGSRVIGVRTAARERGSAGEQVLMADLVVDTTGRGSRTPAWLAELGFPRPAVEQINIGLSYTTCEFVMDRHPIPDEQSVIGLITPMSPRGAYFGRCGHNRYVLSLVGMFGDRPEPGREGFVAYAKSLPFPDLYEAIKDVAPLRDPVTMQYPASVRRRYERLSRFPAGLLVMGDAVCSFNPVFGQGMTVSALEALTLRNQLRKGGVPAARTFFRDIAKVVDAAWDISAGGDLSWPQVAGPRSMKVKLGNRYMAKVQAAALVDGTVTGLFMRVCGLVEPATILMRPATMARVLRGAKQAEQLIAATMSQPPAGSPPDAVGTDTRQAA